MKKFSKMLVPTDFSEASGRALEYAFTFASSLDMEMLVLHVIDGRTDAALVYSYDQFKPGSMEKKSHEDMAVEIKRVMEDEVQKGVSYDRKLNVTTKVTHGVPYDQILQVAKKEKADFIVMGAKGATALEEIFMGGVAEKVSRRAPCPVFLVRRRRHQG